MQKNTVLEVKNLTKTFETYTAVDNLSFTIDKGEVLGMLGPNGAGKTTTIQMLLGVMEQTAGNISYFGKPFKKHRGEILKQINFASTYISMPWLFTIDEILDIYARLYEISDRKKRINHLLAAFEIEHLRKKQFNMLSAGEKTRLFLTKAFLNYPKLVLLDEPTASLDPEIAIKIRDFLKKEQSEYEVSMLFTSHNMSEVEEMCDRVLIMKAGKIIEEDTPNMLAKKMHNTHLELVIIDEQKKATTFFEKSNLQFSSEKNRFKIYIDEKKIAPFLQELSAKSINFEEIVINKPTLEDFFLDVVNRDDKKQKKGIQHEL